MKSILDTLLTHEDPAVGYLTRLHLLDEKPDPAILKDSPQIQGLLGGALSKNPYDKWMGAHWRLVQLAALGYVDDPARLKPMREQMRAWVLRPEQLKYYEKRVVAGKTRMHPSIEGNFIHYSLLMGFHDACVDDLVETIISWQWPDGGWNCDMKPHVQVSSFTETWIPARALGLYAARTGHAQARRVAHEAAEVLLRRKLFRRITNNAIMHREFVQLHYPVYWHYDYLSGLELTRELGLLADPRCAEALDLLESQRLVGGGFPATSKYYTYSDKDLAHSSPVNWGGTSKTKLNPWVTLQALLVLRAAGRWTPGAA
jgi:hypothetical protein